jgi:cytoskeletal protein CcmA (bactofilin family)
MNRLVAAFAAFLCAPWPALANDVAEASIRGNEFRAGGRVEFHERVKRSAYLSGGDVTVRGAVGRNLYAAGGEVRLEGEVGGDARLAGGSLRVEPAAQVTGDATLAGGSIDVDGSIGGDLSAYGDRVFVNGRVDGDVRLAGDRLRLGPKARISGEVSYRSGQDLVVDPGAQAGGGIEAITSDRAWRRAAHGASIVGGITLSLGLMLLGAILVLAMPRFSREAVATIGQKPWEVLGLGLAVLVGVPVLLVMLVITIIGIPLAVLLALAYGALLMIGYLVGALFVGDFALGRIDAAKLGSTWWRALFMVLAIVVIAIVDVVPVLGPVATGILFLAGLGAFTRRAWAGFRNDALPGVSG